MLSKNRILVWLYIGLVMVFIQVLVGGITRLTESGLSITKWEVVSGTLPPLSSAAWDQEFELYKNTPQYREINEGISMSQFKFIYFWEYIHRFWARLMGFVFIIPFLFFYFKKLMHKKLMTNLLIVVLLAMLAATFGWIMVASGLIERPWVNAYKLSIHLMIAFTVFSYLYWTYLREKYNYPLFFSFPSSLRIPFFIFTFLLVSQIFLGGMMSGMKIAVVYPSWPSMNGQMVPDALFNKNLWSLDSLTNYDKNEFTPAFVHFLHRGTAYLLLLSYLYLLFCFKTNYKHITSTINLNFRLYLLGILILFQMILGIITVLLSIGKIPIFWGVMHQAGALLLLTMSLNIFFILKIKK